MERQPRNSIQRGLYHEHTNPDGEVSRWGRRVDALLSTEGADLEELQRRHSTLLRAIGDAGLLLAAIDRVEDDGKLRFDERLFVQGPMGSNLRNQDLYTGLSVLKGEERREWHHSSVAYETTEAGILVRYDGPDKRLLVADALAGAGGSVVYGSPIGESFLLEDMQAIIEGYYE